ncbi:MAG TPA: hypothetical protein DIW64_06795 [Cellvibrio sp.]|nr:hypothetical protein [Cellvibrio sp.]
MENLTKAEIIAIVGVLVAVFFGIIEILKKTNSKSKDISVTQKSGMLSKGKQSVKIKIEKDDQK